MPKSQEVSPSTAPFEADIKDPAKPFTLMVQFQVREGSQEALEATFRKATVATRHDQGVLAYSLNRDARNSTRYVVFERWRCLADLEAHLQTPHITELAAVMGPLLDGVPEFRVLLPAEGDAEQRLG